MKKFILYTTDGCHLCEQAIGMFYYAKQQGLLSDSVELLMQDIISDEQLVAEYGERIPVIRSMDTGQELGWPFELESMVSWFNSQ